jgi:adenylylsulfate kinase
MKILVMGLAGAGKTTLAKRLAIKLSAVHFNADEIRENINKDLGFSNQDRLEQSKRMGFLCDVVSRAGYDSIADFICPTEETRTIFNPDFIIWVNRISECVYSDTNAIFVKPKNADVVIEFGMTVEEEINLILQKLNTSRNN